MSLHVWKYLIVTQYLAKLNGHRPCGSRDITSVICHVTTLQDPVIRDLETLWNEAPHCMVPIGIMVVEIIMFLINPVASHDHVFKKLYDVMGGNFS